MLKKDLLNLIKNASEEQDIDDLLKDSDLGRKFTKEGLTLDNFKELCSNDEIFKSFLEGEKSNNFENKLSEWKKENLEKELEPFIKEKYPKLIDDPLEKKFLEQQKEIERMKADNAKKDLLNLSIKYINDNKKAVPGDWVEKFLGEDFETTKTKLDEVSKMIEDRASLMFESKIKDTTYIPGMGGDGETSSIGQILADNANKNSKLESDPWANE